MKLETYFYAFIYFYLRFSTTIWLLSRKIISEQKYLYFMVKMFAQTLNFFVLPKPRIDKNPRWWITVGLIFSQFINDQNRFLSIIYLLSFSDMLCIIYILSNISIHYHKQLECYCLWIICITKINLAAEWSQATKAGGCKYKFWAKQLS